MPGRRPDTQLARRCGQRVGEDQGALLGQPERRLVAAAAVVKREEAARKLASRLDWLEVGVWDVVAPEQPWAERAGPVAARKEIDVPDMVRLKDDEEGRRAGVEPVPHLVHIVGRRDRIEQGNFPARLDARRRDEWLPVDSGIPIGMLDTPHPQARLDVSEFGLHAAHTAGASHPFSGFLSRRICLVLSRALPKYPHAMRGAIAAGHPLTAEAGARVLAEGGNAVDALLASAFVAFVTEGPLTGPAGGGFLLVHEAEGETTVLDCFFGVPAVRLGEMEEVLIHFADSGTQVFHIGDGSVAVPGLLAGLEEAHRRFATWSWADLVSPAIDLAREGVLCDEPRAFLHRILGPVLLRDEGGRRLYGNPARVVTADLAATLERVRDVGARAVGELLPEYADDLAAYRVATLTPLETTVLGRRVLATPPPSRGGAIVVRILELLAAVEAPSVQDEAWAIGQAYSASAPNPAKGTTHVSVVDAFGTAAALSATLGSGSGVFRGGAQLNNMLGELDVIGAGERPAGERLPSMMTPTLMLESGHPRLVVGSAGSVRLAGAIAQVTWRVLQGVPVAQAIESPRLHVDGGTLHLEGGRGDDGLAALSESWDVVRWEGINLFFGGVQAVERTADGTLAAAGDPRRGGAGLVVG
jgi:gamma-glutamyltranspeptidase / glutathione hydrolase